MNVQEIITSIEQQIAGSENNQKVDIAPEILSALQTEDAVLIVQHFGANLLMKLPAKEIVFFDWLKQEHNAVWLDLWGNDDEESLYHVSISFLPLMLDPVRGYPICDLMSLENFYFTPEHLVGEDIKFYLEAVKERFLKKETLTIAQLLALEISMAPIDIWRFSYHHGLDMNSVLAAIKHLKEDRMLMHFGKAEDLADYVEFLY